MGQNTFKIAFEDGTTKTATIEIEPDFPWSVTREGEDITFKLGEGDNEKEKNYKTADIRAFLIKNFNWNGIVNMMHLLEEKSDRLESYTRPTTLKGIPSNDDLLIIPDEATEAIIYEQAKYAIETTYTKEPEKNIDAILDDVHGKAKTGFAKDILDTTYDDLLKEVDNTVMEYNNTSFTMPNLETVTESDLYDFLKSLTLARNGLWLEYHGLTNLVSIRRKVVTGSKEDTGYNDTLLLAWKDDGVKKVTKYIATTEPGKINKARGKMLPQTTTMFLGMHQFNTSKMAIPAFRSINVYRKKKNSNDNAFSAKDDGLNIHFSTVYGKVPIGIPTSISAYGVSKNKNNLGYSEKEMEAYLTIVKVYKTLSDWGAGNKTENITCYKNLENHTKNFTLSDMIGTTDTDKKLEVKIGEKVEKTIKLSSYRAYIKANYSTKAKKPKALQLLMYYNTEVNNGVSKSSYDDTSIADIVVELNKEAVFKSIVQLQFNEEKNISNIDGKPGTSTITKAERTVTKKTEDTKAYNDQIEKAELDWATITEDFATWNSNSNLKDSLKTTFQTKLKMVTDDLKGKTITDIDNLGGQELQGNVGGWSHGCQVISGVQKFFHFMGDITEFAGTTNQERWYYTIIESSTIGITLN